jgi:hypothetical protein
MPSSLRRTAASALTASWTAVVPGISLLHLLAERAGPAVVRFAIYNFSRGNVANNSLAELVNVYNFTLFSI